MRRLSALLLLMLLPLVSSAATAPVRLAYLFSDGNTPGTLLAFQALLREHPELQAQVQLTLLTESVFDQVDAQALLTSDVLVLDTMNEPMLARFNTKQGADLVKTVAARGTVLGVGQGLLGEDAYKQQGVVWDPRARAYWTHSGSSNQLALLKLALMRAGVAEFTLPDPQLSLDFGYYYPDGSSGRVFATWDEFNTWRMSQGKVHAGRPRVAISFFKAAYYSGDTALLDALIAEVERQGADAIPVFGYPGAVSVERLLLDATGTPRADVVLGSNFNFSDFDAARLLGKAGLPVLNLVTLYGRSEREWRESATGLSMFEGTFNLAVPELAGTTAPTVVASKEKLRDPVSGISTVVTRPIEGQTALAVSRALRYAALRTKRNADKNVAILFYNYPAGKANIGASYLNVAESLANILQRLAAEGYDVGDAVPDAEQVLVDITSRAYNVSSNAPGELSTLIEKGAVTRVPVTDYRAWLDSVPAVLRNKILKDWGEPERSDFMMTRSGDTANFIVPAVRYGRMLLTPQPARGWGEDLDKLYHANDLAPPHQYSAVYAWLRNGFKADAVVHVGTHGTLEWLDGKDAGLSPEDAPDALIADLPNLYIYNVDVVGEGLVARRRSMATLVDHMVPPFKKGGLTAELAALSETMNDHTLNESKNPELATHYAQEVRERALKLGIGKDLGLAADSEWTEEQLHEVEAYLLDLKGQNMPYGLHAFGRTPEKDLRDSTVEAIVSADRSLLPDARNVLATDMEERIVTSGPRELDSLMRALSGGFVPVGNGGEPIRNPDVYATGKNFYGIDPDRVPKPASWEMGVKLADEMLAEHLKKHGRYPEKVSFVIWGDETMRHEGVVEAQVFHLLGTRPVWNERGKVVGVTVVPRTQLGRPRIDIVIASAAEGMFNNVTRLMDEAVQKAKAMDEADNLVRKHYLATRATLVARGYKPEDADRLAGVRIFDEPPGTFNLNTSGIVAASGSWDKDAGFANEYLRKMGHGYGNGFWGEPMEDVFRLALAGTDKVVHSSSTSLYGALDNDDMFMYMGGLAAAVRSIDGTTPELTVTNTRDPGKAEMTDINEFIGKEFRSRYVNPAWIEGMKKEGYAGAGEMRAFVEYLWGWDATVTTTVDDAMWQETFATYVADKHGMDLKNFFESKSPFAYQDMTARMMETVRKGYWEADTQTRATLAKEFIESINAHGVSCSELTCGNARLLEYALDEALAAGVPVPDLERARAVIEQAIGTRLETAARQLKEFAARNDALQVAAGAVQSQGNAPAEGPASPPAAPPGTAAAGEVLRGILLEQQSRSQATVQSAAMARGESSPFGILWIALPLFALLFLWRHRYLQSRA